MIQDRSHRQYSKLRPLRSMQLEPTNAPVHQIAMQQVKEIRSIQVSSPGRINRKGCYIVEVFTDSTRSDILTATSSGQSSAESTDIESSGVQVQGATTLRPDARSEKELFAFIRLQDKVYNCVRLAHPQLHCSFCLKMANLMVFGANPDGIWLRLLGGDRAARVLTKFVSDVVDQCSSIETREGCPGQMLVIEAVHEFLFTPVLATADL